jgi:hypothetical protein
MNWRYAAAALLLLLAVCGVPSWDRAEHPKTVEAPSGDMQLKVKPIAVALAAATPADRMIWASVWERAAKTVEGEEGGDKAIFTDTRSLRGFTVLAIDIAWRRIGGNPPGKYLGLREAVEQVLGDTVGTEIKPITGDVRARYAEACKAIAWAGINGG